MVSISFKADNFFQIFPFSFSLKFSIMMMVNGNLVGVEVSREEICERGKKRQKISNKGGVIRQEEETCEIGNKRRKILNELIDQCSFKIYPQHKLDGNIHFGEDANLEKSGDDHMSPEKALRAAMLKSRFAETISKAAKTMQIAVKQSNELEICRQRQRKVLEENERCNELERRRKREREALEEMEKAAAANVDNTTAILKSLGFSTSWFGYEVGD